MATVHYVRIPGRSWHIDAGNSLTRCGRLWPDAAERAERLPLDAKSCESCLRLDERGETDAGPVTAAVSVDGDEREE